MNLAANIAAQVAAAAPVPYLQPAFTTFQIILTSIGQLTTNRHQMRAIAQAAAQILLALNAQGLSDANPAAREELERTLSRIEKMCVRMGRRRFVRAFLDSAADQNEITLVHAELTLCVDAFQIGTQVSMLAYAWHVEDARQEDQTESSEALRQLLEKQDALLELIGDAPAMGGANGSQGSEETQQTIFRLLEGILTSLKTADIGTGRDEDFKEALMQLRKITAPARVNANPILALLQPGLTPDALVSPLKWRMNKVMYIEIIAFHLTREQCAQFSQGEIGSQQFIDHLVNCEDRPLQYGALEFFLKDKDLKHFFKQDFVFTPSDDPNPILANLKPGLTPEILILPLRYEGPKLAWIEILRQQLYSDQIASFFKTGAEGCERFIKYITEGDSPAALQYAALQVFREHKLVMHFFIPEETPKAEE